MRVTTVASVTEQNGFFPKNQRKQLLRTVFDRYVLIYPTTHSLDPSATRHINSKQRNAVADSYGAPPQIATSSTKAATTRRIRQLRPHSPHDTLSLSILHTLYQQQPTKRINQYLRSISLNLISRRKQLLHVAYNRYVLIHVYALLPRHLYPRNRDYPHHHHRVDHEPVINLAPRQIQRRPIIQDENGSLPRKTTVYDVLEFRHIALSGRVVEAPSRCALRKCRQV